MRSPYSFANINLLGKCNAGCYFCLGKDLEEEFSKYNYQEVHFDGWKNYQPFLCWLRKNNIKQVYVTGQNTDPLLYKYLPQLLKNLQGNGCCAGIRTNGFTALKNMHTINQCTTCMGDAVGYTINTLQPKTQNNIAGTLFIPNWEEILNQTQAPFRVSIVLTRCNKEELMDLLAWLGTFSALKYVQVRKVSTETRKELLQEDREVFEQTETMIRQKFPVEKTYENASIYNICGKPVSFWRTVDTTANSVNYFVNGVFSKQYHIIKGYLDEQCEGKGMDVFFDTDVAL